VAPFAARDEVTRRVPRTGVCDRVEIPRCGWSNFRGRTTDRRSTPAGETSRAAEADRSRSAIFCGSDFCGGCFRLTKPARMGGLCQSGQRDANRTFDGRRAVLGAAGTGGDQRSRVAGGTTGAVPLPRPAEGGELSTSSSEWGVQSGGRHGRPPPPLHRPDVPRNPITTNPASHGRSRIPLRRSRTATLLYGVHLRYAAVIHGTDLPQTRV
jgi:hypothetical protein